MNDKTVFDIRPISDRVMLEELLRLRWSDETIFIRGQMLHASDVEGLGAYLANRLQGVAIWRLEGKLLHLVTMNNITDQRGVGAALVDGLIKIGRDSGAAVLRAYLGNDNVDGLRFYQRRGFRIAGFFPGYVDMMRRLKPSMPERGMHGIPIRDGFELEFEL